jgi:rhomboid family protein
MVSAFAVRYRPVEEDSPVSLIHRARGCRVIPLHDEVQSRTFPFVNYSLILINVVVFLYELTLSEANLAIFFYDWGLIPNDVVGFFQGEDVPSRTPFTLLTAMFLHGGWLHFLGNMLFLWIFGDNIEDSMGHKRYLAFYLLGGLAASALQIGSDPDSTTPNIGASGAISAVMGAYVLLYPRANIVVLVFVFAMTVPAWALIGIWFATQVLSGLATLGATEAAGASGVAWFAHIGGFLFGFVAISAFKRRKRPAQRYRVFARGPWD